MTWHDMKNKNTMHGKINYRDSGDGVVSTRVDTEQVSKIAKGRRNDMMKTIEKEQPLLSCDNMTQKLDRIKLKRKEH